MKKLLMIVCFALAIVAFCWFGLGNDQSYARVNSLNSPLAAINDFTCSKGKWVDKNSYVFYSEMKTLSIESKKMAVEISLDKESKKEGEVARVYTQNIKLNYGQSAYYKESKEGRVYDVRIALQKVDFLGGWIIYVVNGGYDHAVPVSNEVMDEIIRYVDGE